MENDAYFIAALERAAAARAAATAEALEAEPHVWETAIERVTLRGIHRDPKPGAIQQPGNKRVPQPYIFVGGKRVSTGRMQRFSKN